MQGSIIFHGFVLLQVELSSVLSLLGSLNVSLESWVIVVPNLAHGDAVSLQYVIWSSLETTKH